jgi:ribonuclease P protein component
MINRTHRFQGHGSLRFAYQKGNIIRGSMCSLKYIDNNRRHTYRVAVVVSRKVHRSAVVRNRIRRRIYELVRVEANSIKRPFDLVFIIYSDQLATMSSNELREIVLGQLMDAKVIGISPRPDQSDHDIVEQKES